MILKLYKLLLNNLKQIFLNFNILPINNMHTKNKYLLYRQTNQYYNI